MGDNIRPYRLGIMLHVVTPDKPRKHALWGKLMGGGSGMEWYFGSRFPHMDITTTMCDVGRSDHSAEE